MTIEINGMAHVILTLSRFEVAREFHRRLLPESGRKVVFRWREVLLLRRGTASNDEIPALAYERFVQQQVGFGTTLPASPLARGH